MTPREYPEVQEPLPKARLCEANAVIINVFADFFSASLDPTAREIRLTQVMEGLNAFAST